MFELNKDFLEGLGVPEMEVEEEKAFLAHLQEELEVRVGERMSEGMSEGQIDEFEKVIDGDAGTVAAVLSGAGDYRGEESYKKMAGAMGLAEGSGELDREYASLVWLNKNCPQYSQIVQSTVAELKEEVKAGKDRI